MLSRGLRLLTVVLLLVWQSGAVAAVEKPPLGLFTHAECVNCHEKSQPEIVDGWRSSSHGVAEPVIGCTNCHGANHADSKQQARGSGSCLSCHGGAEAAVAQSYRLSKHGIIATLEQRGWNFSQPLSDGNYRTPTCAYCHMHGGEHGMVPGNKKSDPLLTPDPEEAEKRNQDRGGPCLDCHSPRFTATWFASGEKMLELGRKKAREARAVVQKISAMADADASSKAASLLENMLDEHLRNVGLGVFHQSPDHQWWHGHPALDGDLLRIKGVFDDLNRCRALKMQAE